MRRLKYTKPDPSEKQLHKVVAELLDWCLLPPALFTTFPAGWGKLSPTMAGELKECGLKPGMPDILVFSPVPRAKTIGLELKRPRTGRISEAQAQMQPMLIEAGVLVFVVKSPEEVIRILHMEGVPLRRPRPESSHGLHLAV